MRRREEKEKDNGEDGGQETLAQPGGAGCFSGGLWARLAGAGWDGLPGGEKSRPGT